MTFARLVEGLMPHLIVVPILLPMVTAAVMLLLGDTLHDFDGVFRKAATDVKRAEVDRNAAHFGADWIVFPNATYGDWSTAPLTAWDAPLKTQ